MDGAPTLVQPHAVKDQERFPEAAEFFLKKPTTVEIGNTGARPPITNIAHEPPAIWPVRMLRRIYVERQRIYTVIVMGGTLLVGYHVLTGKNGWSSFQQKQKESVAIQQEIERLRKENEQLKQHVGRLENDPDEIEHEAREQLHYARPGEVIYTMTDRPAAQNTQPAPTQK